MKLSENIQQFDKTFGEKIECFIKEVDHEFVPLLSSRVNISEWSKKLNALAVNIGSVNSYGEIEAMISFYCNQNSESYISFIAVSKSQRGKKIAQTLLDDCIQFCIDLQSTSLKVETWSSNKAVINLYQSRAFIENEIRDDRPNEKSIVFQKIFLERKGKEQ